MVRKVCYINEVHRTILSPFDWYVYPIQEKRGIWTGLVRNIVRIHDLCTGRCMDNNVHSSIYLYEDGDSIK